MPKAKITKSLLDQTQASDKDQMLWDTEIKSFGVKVTPAGNKVFLLQYRMGGRGSPTRKHTIGRYGDLTVHQARTKAQEARGLIANGIDPAAERRSARSKFAGDGIASIVAEFIDKHASQNRTADQTRRILSGIAEHEWRGRSIHSITKPDINEVLDLYIKRGKHIMANRVLAALRKMFNWCVSRGIIETSPCSGVSAPAKERKRERVLSDDELASVMRAARNIEGVYGRIVELLILTGQRRDEVTSMTWSEVDLDNAAWTLPGARTKNGKPHIVHLTGRAVELLQQAQRLGNLVFTTNGRTPFSGFSKSKRALDEASGVSDWRIHDIRRTIVTGMANMGVPPHIADKILNHQSGTISGVAAVYQKAEFLDERRDALERWAEHVDALVIGATTGNSTAS